MLVKKIITTNIAELTSNRGTCLYLTNAYFSKNCGKLWTDGGNSTNACLNLIDAFIFSRDTSEQHIFHQGNYKKQFGNNIFPH